MSRFLKIFNENKSGYHRQKRLSNSFQQKILQTKLHKPLEVEPKFLQQLSPIILD